MSKISLQQALILFSDCFRHTRTCKVRGCGDRQISPEGPPPAVAGHPDVNPGVVPQRAQQLCTEVGRVSHKGHACQVCTQGNYSESSPLDATHISNVGVVPIFFYGHLATSTIMKPFRVLFMLSWFDNVIFMDTLYFNTLLGHDYSYGTNTLTRMMRWQSLL